MKRLATYIKDNKSSLISLNEKFRVSKDMETILTPKSLDELRNIIEDRIKKQGFGTAENPIDFNDIDISKIQNLHSLFWWNKTSNKLLHNIKYIDISEWNVSNVTSFRSMLYDCENLVSVGDLSNWDMRNAKELRGMFFNCRILENIGDLSKWEVTDNLIDTCSMFCMCYKLKNIGDIGKWEMRNVSNTCEMFNHCDELEYIGDISSWDLRSVISMAGMFRGCKNLTDIGDLSKWQKPYAFKKNHFFGDVFTESSIKNIPYWCK